ncbi:MAG: anthranilate synthase component I family protein [Pseudomonadota bacterium]
MTFFAENWPYLDPADEFERICDQRYALFFDSNCDGNPQNRYSYICWNPVEMIESKDGVISITNAREQSQFEGNPFEVLQGRLELYGMDKALDPDLPPFQGGAAGMFGYDLGRDLERLPTLAQDDLNCPDMAIGIYDQVIAYDHETEQAWFIVHAKNEKDFQRRKVMLMMMDGANHESDPYNPVEWITDKTSSDYMSDIQAAIDNIYAGEVFQVNLSRRLEADVPIGFSKYGHYKYVRDINPAPFSAFMNFGEFQIASSSPEQFLHVQDNVITTRPIKGTLPSSEPIQKLKDSDKDRAENLMIVDLMRNDLSKVADYLSVSVPQLFEIETYEGVHHMVSTVQAKLMPGKGSVDTLQACFPGGSVTGAPKIRAMELIEEMEPYRRGPYCGSLGLIGFDGYMNTSITIRTLIYANENIYLQTGGGIVSDSKPEAELQETLDKADALLGSFEHPKRRQA